MLFNYSSLEIINAMTSYLIVYNITNLLFFAILLKLSPFSSKTFYSLNLIPSNNIFSKLLTLLLLSMAGVPPFTGFFTKILILSILTNSNFSLLFITFFLLLFTGLYFYVQNVRFIQSKNKSTWRDPSLNAPTDELITYVYGIIVTSFLISGSLFLDDLIIQLNLLF